MSSHSCTFSTAVCQVVHCHITMFHIQTVPWTWSPVHRKANHTKVYVLLLSPSFHTRHRGEEANECFFAFGKNCTTTVLCKTDQHFWKMGTNSCWLVRNEPNKYHAIAVYRVMVILLHTFSYRYCSHAHCFFTSWDNPFRRGRSIHFSTHRANFEETRTQPCVSGSLMIRCKDYTYSKPTVNEFKLRE